MPDLPAPLVRLRNLRYSYPGGPEILRIPSLDVTGRGLIALTGPSGAGKSTLVELLAGTLHEGYDSSVEVLGEEWRDLRRDADRQRHLRRIGFIPQDFGLLSDRSPREMLIQDLTDSGVPATEHAERIVQALAAVDLTELADQRIASLSGGQGQRVAIARMLARDVDLVIADEPTANLDPDLRGVVMGLLRKLSDHVPVIVVTHDAVVAEACDRTIILQPAALAWTEPETSSSHPARSHRRRSYLAVLVVLILAAGGTGIALAATHKAKNLPSHHAPPPKVGVRMETLSAGEASAPAYEASMIYPQLTPSGHNGATTAMNSALSAEANRVLGAFEGLVSSAPVETTGTYAVPESSLTGYFFSDLLNEDFVSFTLSFDQYESGAAHGIETVETFNFNARTGKQYQLADLFRSGTDWLGALSAESRSMLPGVEGSSYGDLSSFIDPGTTPKLSNFSAWALTPWGLSIQFQTYQVGPFAAGNPIVVIPYGSLQPLLSTTSPILKIEKAPPARTILLPAVTAPVVNECVARVSYTSTGLGPLTCPNGDLNVNAWNDITEEGEPFLSVSLLGRRVTSGQLKSAMCNDVHRFVWVTAQTELKAERLGVLYYGWRLPTNPAVQFPYYCSTK